LFARKPPSPERFSLKPEDQPQLFRLHWAHLPVGKCAPPSRVDVDCEVNASASFRRGLASMGSNDVVLTIGLPLVAA